MKKVFIYCVSLAVVIACNTEIIDLPQGGTDSSSASGMIVETISGSHGVSTKATIDANASFIWTAGDNLAVHVSNGDSHKYVFTSGDGGASVSSATADFVVSYEEGYARDAFAVFPSTIVAADAANYGQSGHALDVTLPASYTLAQVSGETSPCPMIATNAPNTGWTFYQLCGLLRLTVSNIPAGSKRLEIKFDGKNVAGNFAIPTPVKGDGTASIALSNASGSNSATITITKDGTDVALGNSELVLNIPLPIGTYSNITITGYDALTAGNTTLSNSLAFEYSATQFYGTKVTASFPGVFSGSLAKKVVFSPGNLQYLGNADGTGIWRFAEHQYDFMGDGPSSGTSYQGNVDYTSLGYTSYNTGSGSNPPTDADKIAARDLFGWGTSGYNDKYPYMTIASAGSYYSSSMVEDGANYDWGVYHSASGSSTDKITNGGNYSWRLLTSTEWNFVLSRKNSVYTRNDYKESKKLFCYATLSGITTNDIKGVIIFPDGWTGDPIRNIKYDSDGGYGNNVFTAAQWTMLEEMGCVFLPAAQIREGSQMKELNEGNYWSSTIRYTVGEYRGCCVEFWNGNILSSASNSLVRKYRLSVRLIRDAE